MREELLHEILKDFSRWLDEYRLVNRSLRQARALLRRGWERPGQAAAYREAIRLIKVQLSQFDPVLLGGVIKEFELISFDRYDIAVFTEFLRRRQPWAASPPGELVTWLEGYHRVVRYMIRYVEEARFEVMQELLASQGRPADPGRPPSGASLETQAPAAVPVTTSGHPPGLPGSPSRPVPQSGPPELSGYLGVTVDEERWVLGRSGRSEVANLSTSRLLWGLALALLGRGDRCSSLRHLREVWSAHGREDDPQKKTIEDAISRLRKRIRPLGLTVVHKAELGYALAELPSDDEIGPGGSD
jgi:hypothetical protein